MYHTFIELLVCYILCLVRTKVLSDFPFQCIDQNEYVEIILCFPIEAGWLIVVKMWENWSYSWNFKGLILYFQAWMLRYLAMIKIISIFFYHYNILWYVLWLKLVLTFNSQEITCCEVHNNKRLCDNGSGMQRADRGLSHPSCTQLHPQFVYLSCLQTQALSCTMWEPESEFTVVELGWWVDGFPVGLGQALQWVQWSKGHFALPVHREIALTPRAFIHIIAKPVIDEGHNLCFVNIVLSM